MGEKLKPTERDKFLTRREFEKLLLAANDCFDRRTFMFVFVGGALGLRVSEACRLERSNLARLDQNIVSVKTLKIKGQPVLDVAVDDSTRDLLAEYLSSLPAKQRWLFPGARGGPLPERSANRLFKQVVVAAGLNERYSYHALRHYRGMRCWQETGDQNFVRTQMRHKVWATTTQYIHEEESSRVARAKQIKPF